MVFLLTITISDTLFPVIMPVPKADRQLSGRSKVQTLSRLARLALIKSRAISCLRLNSLPKDANGVPLPVDGVHWSLTHKSDVVGAVAARLPVGLDLETFRPVSPGMLTKVAADKEWSMVSGDRLKNFFRLWTAKEAVLKAVGRGIGGLSRCRVVDVVDETHVLLDYAGESWVVEHFWFAGHVAAITCNDINVRWKLVS